jgi:hypothetical protein
MACHKRRGMSNKPTQNPNRQMYRMSNLDTIFNKGDNHMNAIRQSATIVGVHSTVATHLRRILKWKQW